MREEKKEEKTLGVDVATRPAEADFVRMIKCQDEAAQRHGLDGEMPVAPKLRSRDRGSRGSFNSFPASQLLKITCIEQSTTLLWQHAMTFLLSAPCIDRAYNLLFDAIFPTSLLSTGNDTIERELFSLHRCGRELLQFAYGIVLVA